MAHPEAPLPVHYLPIGGDNSCGKSELAKQMSAYFRHPESPHASIPATVIHVGDLYRFFAAHPGGLQLDTAEQVRESAASALSHVRCVVDEVTGEIVLKPNGFDRFVQSAENGHAGSTLGGNTDLTGFIHDFIFDIFATYLPENGIGIIEGRQDWGVVGPAVRVTAPLTVRREFFRQERLDAAHWPIDVVKETMQHRDELDAPILADLKARTDALIDVTRTDHTIEATKRLARGICHTIYAYQEGDIPKAFGVIGVSDRK